MAASRNQEVQGTVAERLKTLGVKGVLFQMAKNGQILELRCEMPTCYCPNGRERFDPWPDPRYAPGHEWSPNADHYPTLKMDGGKLRPWNVRLAHVSCNNMDFGWRKRIRRDLPTGCSRRPEWSRHLPLEAGLATALPCLPNARGKPGAEAAAPGPW